MPDIILPKRIPALVTRRRSVDAPTAADVTTISPAVARDPGLTVPEGAFGGGIGEGLVAVGNTLSEEVRKSIDRQQRLRDATEEAKTKEELLTLLRDGLITRATEADFADDAVREEYNIFVGNQIVDATRQFRGATGAARMSDAASTRLDRTLDDMGKIFIDQSDSLHLRSLEQRGIAQLTSLADQAARQARNDPAAVPDEDPALLLDIHLGMFEEAAAAFDGAFKGNKAQDIRAAGRVKIIEQFLTGIAEDGRGSETQALLENEEIAGSLDDVTRARLTRNTKALTEAHDQDRAAQAQRETAAAAREKETKALTFTTGFRSRLEGGEATLAEIATAHNEGVLTTAQADRLTADFTAGQNRRSEASARAERISSKLQAGTRLDPEDFDDHDDVAHHYAATLKPSLAELGPAQKASAIKGYVEETGIAPDAAIKSLLGLTATGDPASRIAAARELVAVFDTDSTARNKVPPALAAYVDLVVGLADTESISPEEIIRTADAVVAESTPGADQANPALIHLVSASKIGVQTNGQPDVQPIFTEQIDTLATKFTAGTESDEKNEPTIENSESDRSENPDTDKVPGVHSRVIQENDGNRIGIFDGATLIGFAANSEEASQITDALNSGDPGKLATPSDRNDTGSSLGRVLNRVAKAVATEFAGDIGISPETETALRRAGLLPREGDNSIIGAFNSVLIKGGSAAADLAFKSLLAIESGIIAGAGQTARELGETDTDANRLERDLAVLAIVAGRHGKPLKSRQGGANIARQKATPSPAKNQKKSLGNFSERQRIQRLKPRNEFGGPGAFVRMTPERAFESTKFPPRGSQENAFRGLAAVDLVIKDVLAKGPGDLPNAMRRSGLPGGQEGITFRWGKPGEGIEFKGDSGLSHIIAKHGIESVEDVVETIAKGKIVRVLDKPDRVEVVSGKTVATLVLESKGKLETWVLTGFTKKKSTGFFNLRKLTGPIYFKKN